jgi:hypothetical protein
MMLTVLLLVSLSEKVVTVQHVVTSLCGLSILAGGVLQKSSVILNTDYLRGITIDQPGYCATFPVLGIKEVV